MFENYNQLFVQLHLMVIGRPFLALGTTLFLGLGAIAISAMLRRNKTKQHNMADKPPIQQTDIPTTSTQHITPAPSPAPVSRTSSSSTSSSDLLLPTHIPHHVDPMNKRSSSWPAPIPWRSSWGFLQQHPHHHHHHHQEPEQTEQPQQPQQVETPSTVPGSRNNTNFLALPPTTRRTGSMEARKGSACAWTEGFGFGFGFGLGLGDGSERRRGSMLVDVAAGVGSGSGLNRDLEGGGQEGEGEGEGGDGILVGVGEQFS